MDVGDDGAGMVVVTAVGEEGEAAGERRGFKKMKTGPGGGRGEEGARKRGKDGPRESTGMEKKLMSMFAGALGSGVMQVSGMKTRPKQSRATTTHPHKLLSKHPPHKTPAPAKRTLALARKHLRNTHFKGSLSSLAQEFKDFMREKAKLMAPTNGGAGDDSRWSPDQSDQRAAQDAASAALDVRESGGEGDEEAGAESRAGAHTYALVARDDVHAAAARGASVEGGTMGPQVGGKRGPNTAAAAGVSSAADAQLKSPAPHPGGALVPHTGASLMSPNSLHFPPYSPGAPHPQYPGYFPYPESGTHSPHLPPHPHYGYHPYHPAPGGQYLQQLMGPFPGQFPQGLGYVE